MTTNNRIASQNASDSGLIRWFLALVLIGPIHMAEQMVSGLDTLYELQALVAVWQSYFDNPDVGTVILVIAAVTLIQSLLLATLAGGRWRLFAAGFFGVQAVGEAHHLIQAAVNRAYFPGLITSIAYTWIGVMVVRAIVREWPSTAAPISEPVTVA
jgi:hypothetical protein